MVQVAVEPARLQHGLSKGAEVRSAEAGHAESKRAVEWIYIIQPVHKLPIINVTRTLAGVLAGPERANSVDMWVTRLGLKHYSLWLTIGVLFCSACPSLLLVQDPVALPVISVLSAMLMMPVVVVHTSALCWDMLVLLAQTFEFWFLIVYNVADKTLWNILFGDVRSLACVVAGFSCAFPILLDANLHMRVTTLHLFLPGATAVLLNLLVANMHVANHLVYSSINVWGAQLKLVDAMVNTSFTIGFFMITHVFRYRAAIFSCRRDSSITRSTSTMIQCAIYIPVCRLVPYHEWNKQRRTTILQSRRVNPRIAEKTQLELVEKDQLRIIDARDMFVRFPCSQNRLPSVVSWVFLSILNAIGIAGSGLVIVLSAQEVLNAHESTFVPSKQPAPWHVTAFVATAAFVLVHATFFQRQLVRRICFEIDAWFVSFLVSLVTIGASDVFKWDNRSLLVATVWIWSHWMLFLDALPPVMRSCLRLTRAFIVLVSLMLLIFPLWLGYMILFAPTTATNRNRTFQTRVGHIDVHIEMLSFLLSRVFTVWVWMGRFFWRELLRPRDSFKLIKYRVHFPLG